MVFHQLFSRLICEIHLVTSVRYMWLYGDKKNLAILIIRITSGFAFKKKKQRTFLVFRRRWKSPKSRLPPQSHKRRRKESRNSEVWLKVHIQQVFLIVVSQTQSYLVWLGPMGGRRQDIPRVVISRRKFKQIIKFWPNTTIGLFYNFTIFLQPYEKVSLSVHPTGWIHSSLLPAY